MLKQNKTTIFFTTTFFFRNPYPRRLKLHPSITTSHASSIVEPGAGAVVILGQSVSASVHIKSQEQSASTAIDPLVQYGVAVSLQYVGHVGASARVVGQVSVQSSFKVQPCPTVSGF